jgi:hypothetical protein
MSTFFVSLDETNVPTERRPVVLLEVTVNQQKGQLERFSQAHEPELRGG